MGNRMSALRRGTTRRAARRRRRPTPSRAGRAIVVAATLAMVVTGCDAVEQAAGGLSDQAASEAQRQVDRVRDRVGEEAAERLRVAVEEYGGNIDVDRVCELVGDDRLTNSERGRLEVAVELADALGLPADVIGPARQLLESTTGATTQVEGLVEACRQAGASLQDGS